MKKLIALVVAIATDRSLLKGLTWRIVASCETCFLAWLVTGSVSVGLSIMSIEMVSKVFLYWLHDKAWAAAPGLLERLAKRATAETEATLASGLRVSSRTSSVTIG